MEITVDAARADRVLTALPEGMRPNLVDRFRGLGQQFESLIKGTLLTGEVLDRRSGMGQRSIFYRIEDDQAAERVTLVVGANLAVAPYMRILAYGGTIRPKRARFLTVPMPAALTASGVARFSARDVIENPEGHGFEGTFIVNQMIFGIPPGGRGRRLQVGPRAVPLFALRSEVQMPTRNWLFIAKDRLYSEIKAATSDAAVGAARAASAGE